MANLTDIVQRVKAHPRLEGADVTGMPEGGFDFAVSQLVLVCLPDLAKRNGISSFKKHFAMTDPAVATVALGVDGSADLTALMANHGLRIDLLHNGEIRHASSSFPLVRIAHRGEAALGSNYSAMFARYWLEGKRIHTKGLNGALLAGNLVFTSPRENGLDNLEVGLEDELVDLIVERLRGTPVEEGKPE